jgi:hypothetical protein
MKPVFDLFSAINNHLLYAKYGNYYKELLGSCLYNCKEIFIEMHLEAVIQHGDDFSG